MKRKSTSTIEHGGVRELVRAILVEMCGTGNRGRPSALLCPNGNSIDMSSATALLDDLLPGVTLTL